MDYFEQIVDSIDWAPELFLGICLISAVILFLTGVCGWDYKPGLPKYKNPPPPPARHHRLYQPTDKVDTSNPPKETGT